MIDKIKATVSEYLNVPIEYFNMKKGKRDKVEARQIAMYFADKECRGRGKLSLEKIGMAFGGRDHSTIIYARETVEDIMATNKFFKAKVEEIAELLKN